MNAMTKPETLPAITPQPISPMDRIATLTAAGVSPEQLGQYLAVQREWEANEARKAYVDAMATFKASEPLTIRKDNHVSYRNKTGGLTEYDHATIGNVVGVVCAALGRHGFSHRWDTKQADGRITVSCVITHKLGHSEATAMTATADDSGGKNSIQAVASTVTYLQRYTLLAAVGAATSDQEDDDGRDSEPGRPEPKADPRDAVGRNARPLSGAWESMAPETQEQMRQVAAKVKDFVDIGDVGSAYDYVHSLDYDNDHKLALWTQLDSRERKALNTESDKRKKGEKK